jgi:hypothetical protein
MHQGAVPCRVAPVERVDASVDEQKIGARAGASVITDLAAASGENGSEKKCARGPCHLHSSILKRMISRIVRECR